MIRHTVILTLKYAHNTPQEQGFLEAALELARIPGVQHFECLQQVSKKNNFDFGISMEFNNQQEYDAYSNHPDHQLFIQNHWIPCVDNFLEIDYVPLDR